MFDWFDRSRAAANALALCAVLTLTTAVPRFAAAQSAPQSVAQLKARLLATLRNAKAARDSLDTLRTRRARENPPDSVVAGAIRLRFDASKFGPALGATVQSAARNAATVSDSVFGDGAPAAAGGTTIIATREHDFRLQSLGIGSDYIALQLADSIHLPGRSTTVGPPLTQRRIENAILDLVGTAATIKAPKNVVEWAGFWTTSHPIDEEQWTDAAIDLTTSNASVARSCYMGSVVACESALGLTTVRDPLTEWYSPEGWRVLVGTWMPAEEWSDRAREHDECVKRNVAATCERLARERPVPVPLSMFSRTTFIGLALQRGGRSAYSRLLAARGSPLEVLSATAGVTADSLVSEWRAHVLASVPRTSTPRAAEMATLVAWSVLFGVAAARRRPS
jgi:hypothetical protein